ncbi:MAG: DUF554 domain-containing protein [Butyrivibrio sp.]|nr:DUF554 domain-containing protein [Butyrivibrio sp.]
MPIGVIINALSVVFGGIIGAVAGNKLTDNFKDKMNMIFGCCSMGMGISTIVLMENMPAVIFSVIIGTGIGLAIHLGDLINKGAKGMQGIISKFVKTDNNKIPEADFIATLVTCIVLFCASGTGIYGSIVSGMTGDHSILIAKSILDLFTALIFACTLGLVVSIVAIPQFIIFLLLFVFAGFIFPLTNATMINDFKACGGFIMLATGFRMIKVKMFPTADMIPSMIIVMPISALWVSYILPLVTG